MEVLAPATRPQNALPKEGKREETALLDLVSVAWVSTSPVLSTDNLSDVGRVTLGLTELEQYSCLVGKVYWEDFNCFTMSVFTCFSSVFLCYTCGK